MWSETQLVGDPSVSHERSCFPRLVCYLPPYQTQRNNFIFKEMLSCFFLFFLRIWNSFKASELCLKKLLPADRNITAVSAVRSAVLPKPLLFRSK